jgi:phage shock protein E
MQTLHTRSWSSGSATATLAVMAVAAITGISACSSEAPASGPASSSAAASSSTSPATGQHLAVSDFSTAVSGPGTIVLDVRTPAEYATGHLPKAQNIDLQGADFATRIASLDKSATYAVYCHSGQRSATAMEQMAGAGFTHVFDLAGGITDWQSAGRPVVR